MSRLLFAFILLFELTFSSLATAKSGRNQSNDADDDYYYDQGYDDQRGNAHKRYYIGFGPTKLFNLNASGAGYYFAWAYCFDLEQALIKIRVDLAFDSGAIFGDVGLGLHYFLSEGNASPFVGGDFGFGLGRVDNAPTNVSAAAWGFVFGPVVGVQLFRQHAINLDFALRFVFLTEAGFRGNPYLFAFRVGLYF